MITIEMHANYADKHEVKVEILRIGKFGENTLDSSLKIKQKILKNLPAKFGRPE